MIGSYQVPGGEIGFLYSGGVFTDFKVPGALETYVTGINDAGHIVGWYYASGGVHGFLYIMARSR
jgi:hypothetical protein